MLNEARVLFCDWHLKNLLPLSSRIVSFWTESRYVYGMNTPVHTVRGRLDPH